MRTASSSASFVCELGMGLAIMGLVAAYNMGCAPMASQPAREAANETRIASSSGGSNAFAASQAVGRQQAELDQLRGIVTTLLGAQAAGRGLTPTERATLLAAARAITPAVAPVAASRPAQAPAAPAPTPAAPPAAAPSFLPSSGMDAGMSFGFNSGGNGVGVQMPMPRVGAVNNVAFLGRAPWQNSGTILGGSNFTISLLGIPYAAEIFVDGIRVCAAAPGNNLGGMSSGGFPQVVVPMPNGGHRQTCVVPPAEGGNQDVPLLLNGVGAHRLTLRYYAYSSYTGVAEPTGLGYIETMDTLSVFPHVVSATTSNMTTLTH